MLDWIINITFVGNIKTYTDMKLQNRFNDMRVEIMFHWDETEFADYLEDDLGSDFDVKEWDSQNGGILDDMFDDVENVLTRAVGQYFGGRVYGKYHNGQNAVYQMTLTEDQLLPKLGEFADQLEDIDEYNNWITGYVVNNGVVSLGAKIADIAYSLESKYESDDTAQIVFTDILEIYTRIVDFSVFEPTPEIVEFLEQYK